MNPNYELLLAVETNNISKAKKAFMNGADVTNVRLNLNNYEMTKLLLERGINNNSDEFLPIAIKKNDLRMIKLLLKYQTPFRNFMLRDVDSNEVLEFLYYYLRDPVKKIVEEEIYCYDDDDWYDDDVYDSKKIFVTVYSEENKDLILLSLLRDFIELGDLKSVNFLIERIKIIDEESKDSILKKVFKLDNIEVYNSLIKRGFKIINIYDYLISIRDNKKLTKTEFLYFSKIDLLKIGNDKFEKELQNINFKSLNYFELINFKKELQNRNSNLLTYFELIKFKIPIEIVDNLCEFVGITSYLK